MTTRSLAAAPIDIVVTATTGHQVANYGPGRNRVDNYFAERNRKLKGQAAAKVDDIFRGVTVWFDGLVSDGSGPGALSDLELKRLVNLHGGAVACVARTSSRTLQTRLTSNTLTSRPYPAMRRASV